MKPVVITNGYLNHNIPPAYGLHGNINTKG